VTGLGDKPISVIDFWPDKATYQPGQAAAARARLGNAGTAPAAVVLELRVCHLERLVHSQRLSYVVAPGETTVALPLELPTRPFMGYGLDLLLAQPGRPVVEASTAVDVLGDWTQAPRYGFLSDFPPDATDPSSALVTLAKYHINVVQFYDWMWRHYVLMPPTTAFEDALGRRLSLETVRIRVAAARQLGMTALGYAAVYAAEPEYAFAHPNEMLYDDRGQAISLEKLFYIMNIHQGNPWRAKILAELARAVADVPFDGLHLDQYGFPKETVFGPGPQPVAFRLDEDFPPFIDDARSAIRQVQPGARVIFNAVGNWPIDAVASSTQDATYIEVWHPYERYDDLQALILAARHLAPEKQVILAAYLTPLHDAAGEALSGAESATLLASAAIWANGGFHLLLGETNGALCDPYYPKYACLTTDFATVMRRYYDFVVRYENLLSDKRLLTAVDEDAGPAAQIGGIPASSHARPGHVWTIARTMPGWHTLSLINLVSAEEARWNAAKPPPRTLRDLEVTFAIPGLPERVFVASPDSRVPTMQPLDFLVTARGRETRVRVIVPQLTCWTMIMVKLANTAASALGGDDA
jgi:dextranase